MPSVSRVALVFNDAGSNNTALGVFALGANTTGNANTAVGGGAMNGNIDGGGNTSVGVLSLSPTSTAPSIRPSALLRSKTTAPTTTLVSGLVHSIRIRSVPPTRPSVSTRFNTTLLAAEMLPLVIKRS